MSGRLSADYHGYSQKAIVQGKNVKKQGGRETRHVDGSRAFKRYRNIEDETLKSVINLIG